MPESFSPRLGARGRRIDYRRVIQRTLKLVIIAERYMKQLQSYGQVDKSDHFPVFIFHCVSLVLQMLI